MGCPYSDKELDYWDGVCNPVGEACYTCEEYDCDHNANPDSSFFIGELEKDIGLKASEELGAQVSSPKAPPFV